MTRIYAASDAVEPVADTDAEQFGNIHLYGVIDGCAVTYDVADMTYDVAAGTILHNGSVVAVSAQANAGTLVADGTNPRWATIYLDSTGTEGLVSGTAAADPSKPETGDNVEIAMVLIEAAQTIANSISVKLDKRARTHPIGGVKYKYKTAAQNFTTATLTNVTATSGDVAFVLAAGTAYKLTIEMYISAVGTPTSGGFKWALDGITAPTAFYASLEGAMIINDSTGASVARTLMADVDTAGFFARTMGTAFGAFNSSGGVYTGISNGLFRLTAFILTNTAGTVTLKAAQNTAAGTSTIASAFAQLEIATAE